MRDINDLDHFVLAPGETLILRLRRATSEADLQQMRTNIERALPGRTVMVLPPEVDVCAGKIEMWGVGEPAADSSPEAMAALEGDRRRDIEKAYAAGKVAYTWRRSHPDQVYAIQQHANPINKDGFDWDNYQYSLTKPQPPR